MSTAGVFHFQGRAIPFREGETIAAALTAAEIVCFGQDSSGRATRYFCGIGACQCCLVRVDGNIVEACLTPAWEGLRVTAAGENDAGA
jgi:Uncharacterized anaerobic dehydrogenase